MRHFSFLVLLLATVPVACAPVQDPITIASGPITGTVSDGVHVYKGIPYARPPVGPLRWHEPLPPKPWTQARAMTAYGPSCPQQDSPLDRDKETLDQSEDCLYLNVWTGAQNTEQRLPVMFWIHGGGLVQGSGAKPFYEGKSLARRGVVVVTINYRLGALGFFTHPAVSQESPSGAAGNWGLLDQIAALQWVRNNIARFGGDPGNVTIFGESAGALSTHILMASPLARGLFHRAIAESGAAAKRVLTLDKSQALWQQKAATIGVTDWAHGLAALRSKSATDLVKMCGGVGALPGKSGAEMLCLDGHVLTEAPADTFAAGQQAPVPFIVGSNADEGTLFAQAAPKTVIGYRFIARRMFGDQADDVLRLYPARTNAEVKDAFAAALGDASFTANARRSARWHAAAGHPTWRYFFNYLPPAAELSGLRVTHGLEIPFVFGTLPTTLATPEARTLSDQMGAYWLAFARTGKPEVEGLPAWAPYNRNRDNVLVFDKQIGPQDHLRAEKCDLWDKVMASRQD
jgi:para-nitrobenzyl esterase